MPAFSFPLDVTCEVLEREFSCDVQPGLTTADGRCEYRISRAGNLLVGYLTTQPHEVLHFSLRHLCERDLALDYDTVAAAIEREVAYRLEHPTN